MVKKANLVSIGKYSPDDILADKAANRHIRDLVYSKLAYGISQHSCINCYATSRQHPRWRGFATTRIIENWMQLFSNIKCPSNINNSLFDRASFLNS